MGSRRRYVPQTGTAHSGRRFRFATGGIGDKISTILTLPLQRLPDTLSQTKRRIQSELDDIDEMIILELQEDARRPLEDIGRRIGISRGTVRNRVNRMVKRDILKLEARVNPFTLPHEVAALVGINLERRRQEDRMREIAQIPGITSVWNTTGQDDLFLEVMVHSVDELNELLFRGDLNDIKNVSRTETFIAMYSETKYFKLPGLFQAKVRKGE